MSTPDLLLLGGTFDPPHQAHVDLAREALERFPAARLLVLPAPQPAGAGGVHKAPTADFASRLAMTKLAFAPLGARVTVEPLEAALPPPHYTVATLTEVRKRWPRASLGFLMGQDSLETFARWRQPKDVLALASLVVAPRAAGGTSLRETATAMLASLSVPSRWDDAAGAFSLAETGHSLYLLPRPVGDAASHLTRAALARGATLPPGWLPPEVERHIKDHHLYGT